MTSFGYGGEWRIGCLTEVENESDIERQGVRGETGGRVGNRVPLGIVLIHKLLRS